MEAATGPSRNGQISWKALETDLGPSAYKSIRKFTRGRNKIVIPNYENMSIGDVILTKPKNGSANPVKDQQIRHGRPLAWADWSHATLYVGNLHIAESTGLKAFAGGGILKSGVQVCPLTKYVLEKEMKILRCSRNKFKELRHQIARYALIEAHINPRGYDWPAAMHIAVRRNIDRIRRSTTTDLRVNCSEFVLECFAIGGQFFVDRFDKVRREQYFLPADFFGLQFDEVVAGQLEVVSG